ncbi:MAG: hypothetical protein US49_C0001G0101 [candidate division TM6 bacterium GW2011_GWF2_37_49]|nr:MAG: hypothetical protein US49_C0001G0101 [candidate division TM6 bacterium GW2011_GWF2_37_49]
MFLLLRFKRVFLLFVAISKFFVSVEANGEDISKNEVVDRIVAFVDGSKVLQSDIDMPRIARDGGAYKLNDIIFELAMLKRATERHVLPSEADVDRQIVSFKIQNGIGDISEADFEKYLKPYKFTTKTYKEQMGCLLAVENLKRMEITDKIVITSQEVETYFKNHQEYSQEEYHLKMIPVKKKSVNDEIDLGWVNREELDKKFHFVFEMKKGDVSKKPVSISEKKYFVEVLDKKERKEVALSQRYGVIERLLTKERMEKELKIFQKKLMTETTVEIIDPIK